MVKLPTRADVRQVGLQGFKYQAPTAEADTSIGDALVEIGGEARLLARAEQDKKNDALADEHLTALGKDLRELKYGKRIINPQTGAEEFQGGYMSLKGRAAELGREEYENAVQKSYERILGKAENSFVGEKFKAEAQTRLRVVTEQAADHQMKQTMWANDEAHKGRQEDRRQDAITSSGEGYASSEIHLRSMMDKEIEFQVTRNGLDRKAAEAHAPFGS